MLFVWGRDVQRGLPDSYGEGMAGRALGSHRGHGTRELVRGGDGNVHVAAAARTKSYGAGTSVQRLEIRDENSAI